MGAITKRSILRSFALAEANRGGLFDNKFFRLKAGTFMGAIAERSVTRSTA
jgi:hypothetical protein